MRLNDFTSEREVGYSLKNSNVVISCVGSKVYSKKEKDSEEDDKEEQKEDEEAGAKPPLPVPDVRQPEPKIKQRNISAPLSF